VPGTGCRWLLKTAERVSSSPAGDHAAGLPAAKDLAPSGVVAAGLQSGAGKRLAYKLELVRGGKEAQPVAPGPWLGRGLAWSDHGRGRRPPGCGSEVQCAAGRHVSPAELGKGPGFSDGFPLWGGWHPALAICVRGLVAGG
jgi:hypothetical protein